MGLKKLGMAMVAGTLMLVLTAGVALALNQIDCGSISQDPLTPECYGTPQNDAIEGRDAPVQGEVSDIIYARGGDDQVDANNGDDEAYGGAGRDKIEGWGDDKLYGGDDADFLTDAAISKDYSVIRGSSGNDVIDAYDDNAGDTLVCGPGENDTAYFDYLKQTTGAKDAVSPSCEKKVANDNPNEEGDCSLANIGPGHDSLGSASCRSSPERLEGKFSDVRTG